MAMVTIGRLEKQIEEVEQFRVHITGNGRRVRNGKGGLASYRFQRMGFNRSTVGNWTERRFQRDYPGLKVEVLLGDGEVAGPRRKLEGVRKTY